MAENRQCVDYSLLARITGRQIAALDNGVTYRWLAAFGIERHVQQYTTPGTAQHTWLERIVNKIRH